METPEGSRPRSRLLPVIVVLVLLEILAVAVHYFRQDRADIHAAFDRFVAGRLHPNDLQILKSAQLPGLLVKESQTGHPERVRAAVQIAEQLGQSSWIPAHLRIRVHLEGEEADEEAFLAAVESATPEVRRELLDDLIAGRRSARANRMISDALGRHADPDLIAAMHAQLVSSSEPANAWLILRAFAARTDLPLTDRPADWPIYRRHLAGILDPATREALWVQAVKLARELQPPEHELDSSVDWGCGVMPPESASLETLLPGDAFAGNKNISWPLTDIQADEAAERVFSWISPTFQYAEAMAIRWHRTKRITIPHYPYEAPVKIKRGDALFRHRGKEAAKQILDPQHYGRHPWVHVFLGTGPRTERLGQVAFKTGRGRIQEKTTVTLPGSTEFAPVHLGVRLIREHLDWNLEESEFTFEETGSLERVRPDVFHFEGSSHIQRPSGSGGGGSTGAALAGEPIVINRGGNGSWSSSGSTDSESKVRGFVLLIPGADTSDATGPLVTNAVTKFLTRWSEAPAHALAKWNPWAPAELSYRDLAEVLGLTSWIPVPKARDALGKLWKRRQDLTGDLPGDRSLRTLVAMSLLLSGDDAPVQDPEWIDSLDDEEALRVFLFSPASAWPALDPKAAPGVSAP